MPINEAVSGVLLANKAPKLVLVGFETPTFQKFGGEVVVFSILSISKVTYCEGSDPL